MGHAFGRAPRHHGLPHDAGLTIQRRRVRFGPRPFYVKIRTGTTDTDLIDMILCRESIYRLPTSAQPRVIFDVGANIGIAALYYATVYPGARVYCFEPLPENLELLRENVSPFSDRVRVMPYGLSDRSGWFEYFMSNNPCSFGGGGFSRTGHDPSRRLTLELKSVGEALAELGLDHVDVFKIDTEGSELAILRSIPEGIRRGASVILGELHGVDDWRCCGLLAQTHAIELHKRVDRTCFPFAAVRKDLLAKGSSDNGIRQAA